MLSLEQFAECSPSRCYCCARSCVGDSEFAGCCSCVCLYLMHTSVQLEVYLNLSVQNVALSKCNTKIVGTDSVLAFTDICGLTLYVGNQSIRECQVDIVLSLGQFAKLGNGHVIVSDNNLAVVHLKVLYLPCASIRRSTGVLKSYLNLIAYKLVEWQIACILEVPVK